MPLPLGHSAIGFATHSIISNDKSYFNENKLQVTIFIVILSNLPDIDVLFGLILQNNGDAFHRGPTHSILFALIMGFVASRASNIWSKIPSMSFKTCFIIILSHVVADFFLTSSPVSFCWPFEVNWSTGNSGWSQVFHAVFFEAVKDATILFICTFTIMITILFRRSFDKKQTEMK
ncbi:MAG: metal-dependent hydrolase [Desulfosarcina sp.]|nr:metal-dependent hydrolase [Desulfosarcina sp.]MBC2741604.1 metal-dependent hydrolase [Desulfosarcina sp.]MBC2764518.1 metal-dependent hydrolase [Desulfosarcina sp.]